MSNLDAKYRERKFILAMISLLGGVGALYAGLITGGEYNVLVGAVLSLYALNKHQEALEKRYVGSDS